MWKNIAVVCFIIMYKMEFWLKSIWHLLMYLQDLNPSAQLKHMGKFLNIFIACQ